MNHYIKIVIIVYLLICISNKINKPDSFTSSNIPYKKKINDNCAVIMRFGDKAQHTETLDETEMGHSIIIFKENNQCYIFDSWVSSMLTLKEKNGSAYSGKSLNKQANINPIEELTIDNLINEMNTFHHNKYIGTIFEILCLNGNSIFDSRFDINTQKDIISAMTNYKFKNAVRTVVEQNKFNNYMATQLCAASPVVAMNRTASAATVQSSNDNFLVKCINDVRRYYVIGKSKTKHNKSVKKNKTTKNKTTKNQTTKNQKK